MTWLCQGAKPFSELILSQFISSGFLMSQLAAYLHRILVTFEINIAHNKIEKNTPLSVEINEKFDIYEKRNISLERSLTQCWNISCIFAEVSLHFDIMVMCIASAIIISDIGYLKGYYTNCWTAFGNGSEHSFASIIVIGPNLCESVKIRNKSGVRASQGQ